MSSSTDEGRFVPVKLHWFWPTYGDSRLIVGGGHGTPVGVAHSDRDASIITPNLWAGVGLVRGGAGTALVGSHTEVADRIAEYAEIGIGEFILSGYPHLEELLWRRGRGASSSRARPLRRWAGGRNTQFGFPSRC